MAAPAQRAVSGARRERNSNKHKRLFLPGEPGGLIVSLPACMHSMAGQLPVLEIMWASCQHRHIGLGCNLSHSMSCESYQCLKRLTLCGT